MFRITDDEGKVVWQKMCQIREALDKLESIEVDIDNPRFTLSMIVEVKKYHQCYGCESFVNNKCEGEC